MAALVPNVSKINDYESLFFYLTAHESSLKLSKKFVVMFADRPLIRIALL